MARLRFAGRMTARSLFQVARLTISRSCPWFLAMAKRDLTAARAEANHPIRRLLLQGKLPVQVFQLALVVREKLLASKLAKHRLAVHQVTQRPGLFLPLVMLQEQEERLPRVKDPPALQVRVRRCSQGPGPCAFFRGTLAARKCNRAVRCDASPTSARYQLPRNRHGLADYDSRCSRSQRTHARRVAPFPIAAADKYPCLPRPILD
jgi:hypothetical protein